MVEITLPIILQIVQTSALIVGIYYYVMTLRNQRKDRIIEMAFQRMEERGLEYQKMAREIEPTMQGWTTVEEFYEKYHYSKTPELAMKRTHIINNLNFWGYLLREGLVDVDFICRLHTPWFIIKMWERFEPLTIENRKIDPDDRKDFEYLYDAVKRRYPNISADTRFPFHEARESLME